MIGWDSTNVFTYWYQENLCGEQTKTFFEGTIKDIIKIDSSNYAVKIYKKVSKYDISFLINCRISQDQKTKIEKQIKNDVSFFIIKVDTVKTYSPVIISDKSFNGDYYTNFDFDTKLIIFDGLLIDFRLYEE